MTNVRVCQAALLVAIYAAAQTGCPSSTSADEALLDAYGEPLPAGAVLRLGTTRFHHQSWICNAAISPDGRILASVAANNDVRVMLWEAPTGRLLHRLTPTGDRSLRTCSLAFSPDGTKLLTFDTGGAVRLWDVERGGEMYSVMAHRGQLGLGATAVTFSHDGRWIASGGGDCVVRVWSTDGGHELLSFDTLGQSQESQPGLAGGFAGGGFGGPAPPAIAALAFSPDGRLLAAGLSRRPDQAPGGKIRVWDIENNQPVSWIDDRDGELESIAFMPDGRQLISGGNVTMPREKLGRPYPALNVNVAHVRVWDVGTGKMVRELATPQPEVGSGALALSKDGRTLAVGYEYKMSIWDVDSARIRRSIDIPPQWRGGRGLAISADGQTVCAPRGSHAMGLWSTATGELLSPNSDSHSGTVLSIAFADRGRSIVTAGGDATVRVWNAADGRQRWAKTFDRTAYVDVMAVSPNGELIAAAGSAVGPDAGVRILRAATGEEVGFIPVAKKQFHYRVRALVFSVDSRLLAVTHDRLKAGDGDTNLYDVVTRKRLATTPAERSIRYPHDMVFSRDGDSLLTVDDSATVTIWDAATGKLRRQFTALRPPPDAPDAKRKEQRISSATFALDLKTLITSQGRDLLFWDVERGELTASMPSESAEEGGGIVISPDGRRLAMVDRHFTGADAVRVFDLEDRRVIARFDSGQGRPRCVAFSPDNARLVAGMEDGTALVWDVSIAVSQ